MNKRSAHHMLTKLRRIPYWALLISSVLFLIIGVFSLRANNLKSLQLAEQLTLVDQQNGDIETALKELRSHMHGHMNAGLKTDTGIQQPPIRLKSLYDRLVAAEKTRVEAVRSQIYTDAQNYCEAVSPGGFSGSNRIPCVEEYVVSKNIQENPINPDLYMFDFVSPSWSPDVAGLSLLAAAILFLLFIVRLGSEYVLRQQLRHHN